MCCAQHRRCESYRVTSPLSNDDGDVNKNGKKSLGLDWQNNNSARAHCKLPSLHDYDVKLISLFVGDLNTRRRLSFCFPGLRHSLLEFNSRKNCQHLTNWTRWNKRDKGWSSANSRPRSRRRRRCLSSLLKEDPAEECRSSPESFKNPVKKDIYAGS